MSDDHTQHEGDSRSYNPYLIDYHEDTNTFTYSDPWVEITHEDVCNSNYNENIVNEQNSTQWSLPTTTANDAAPTANTTENHREEISLLPPPQPEVPQPEHTNDLINHSAGHVVEQSSPPAAVVEKIVERVTEEVSLSRSLSLTLSSPREWHEILVFMSTF